MTIESTHKPAQLEQQRSWGGFTRGLLSRVGAGAVIGAIAGLTAETGYSIATRLRLPEVSTVIDPTAESIGAVAFATACFGLAIGGVWRDCAPTSSGLARDRLQQRLAAVEIDPAELRGFDRSTPRPMTGSRTESPPSSNGPSCDYARDVSGSTDEPEHSPLNTGKRVYAALTGSRV